MAIGIDGVRVGHWTDPVGLTGCTVVTVPDATIASGEVRGGAPAERELSLLAPTATVERVDAIVLTGGSAFGLACADGVMRWLAQRGRGVSTPGGPVPIVPTLGLFDLAIGDASARPGPEQGYAAAEASEAEQIVDGSIGAGTGATTSSWRGADGRRRGGLRYAERSLDRLVVGALCAVNAFGDVDDGSGEPDLGPLRGLPEPFDSDTARQNTTIGVVVTNARLDKVGCLVVAQGAHDGLARALMPPHSRYDGDAFVAAATGEVAAHVDAVRALALLAVCDAIRAVAR